MLKDPLRHANTPFLDESKDPLCCVDGEMGTGVDWAQFKAKGPSPARMASPAIKAKVKGKQKNAKNKTPFRRLSATVTVPDGEEDTTTTPPQPPPTTPTPPHPTEQ